MTVNTPRKHLATIDDMLRLREAAFATDMFVAAVSGLGLFDRLAERPMSLAEVCEVLDVHERPAEVMVTLLKAWGLLVEVDGRLTGTGIAHAHLVPGAPQDLRPYYASLRDRPGVHDLLYVLKTGHSRNWEAKHAKDGKEEWTALMQRPDFAQFYTAGMDSRGGVLAPDLAELLGDAGPRLLDVAGGSGIYTSAIVTRDPDLRATVLERPPVDDVARWHLDRRGLADRIDVVGGDMFLDPLPEGYDTHLYSHILHDWPLSKCRTLVRKSFDALNPGGRIAIYSAHLDDDKAGPAPVAEYSVLMMYLYEGRCYSVAEMHGLLKEAGFVDLTVRHGVGFRSLITGRKPG